jgi:NitT/TauT family transport system permease protein
MLSQLSKSHQWQQLGLAVGGLGVALVLWWWLTSVATQDAIIYQFSPQASGAAFINLVQDSTLWQHIAVSLKRIIVGLSIALIFGLPLGVLIGASRKIEVATTSLFQFLRMISPLSLMPLAVMTLGIGDAPVYFLLSFAAIWPIILNVAAGVRQLNPEWLLLAQSLSASRWETLVHIMLPGITQPILTGVRLAIGVLWIVLVPCEMLGVSAGLGYFILDTRDRLAYAELMAAILIIGFLGLVLDSTARALQDRWTKQYHEK